VSKLPFGAGSILTGAFLVSIFVLFARRFPDVFFQKTAEGFWSLLSRRKRAYPRRYEIQIYRTNVEIIYNSHALGFLQTRRCRLATFTSRYSTKLTANDTTFTRALGTSLEL
jgi:hypothetical protein